MKIVDMTEAVANLMFKRDIEVAEAILWRVETSHGKGPYHISIFNEASAREKFPWMFRDEQKWYHPLPHDEKGIQRRADRMIKNSVLDDIFAFPSVEAYIKWFNKPWWRRSLENAGFKLVKYHARNVAMGENQCIFSRKEAEKLAEYSPTAFDAEYAGRWEFR